MAKPPIVIPRDLADLPHRISIRYVLALAGYGRATLMKRVTGGSMPAPLEQGGDGYIFNRNAVLAALGLAVPVQSHEVPEMDPWMITPEEQERMRELFRDKRRKKPAG